MMIRQLLKEHEMRIRVGTDFKLMVKSCRVMGFSSSDLNGYKVGCVSQNYSASPIAEYLISQFCYSPQLCCNKV